MLKVRIIPTLLYKDHGLVKGVSFDSWRRVGTALPAIKIYCLREVDELIIVDISATPEGRLIDCEVIDSLADDCFMPLTVGGGGVRSVDDFRRLLRAGADKVAVNTGALINPELISNASAMFGAQCVVVSIDVKKINGGYEVYSHCGSRPTGREPVIWAQEAASLGAGEILLTSIDRDGTMTGYDVDLVKCVTGAVSVPVIASGGAGKPEHIRDVITDGHAAAAAAASVFHFTACTPLEIKRYLIDYGVPVRM